MKTFEILRKHNIHPKKRLGQNFIIDNNIIDKIYRAAEINDSDYILEIGAGLGTLTEQLVKKCFYLWAVECDKKLCDVLNQELINYSSKIDIIPHSILDVDISKIAKERKIKVCGNVPYYITTKILFHLVEYRDYIDYAVLTIQKELAERLLASPGTKTYGRLTVSLRFFATLDKLFEIKPNSFFPAPDVTSVVIKLKFRHILPQDINITLFSNIVEALFQERRKNIQNSLCLLKSKRITKELAKEILDGCEIDRKKRAEQLMLKDFLALTRFISKY